ncbi:MAG: hypothetical protein H0T79_10765 [Deltaproteobacteria bacterium]|nr:hypothetical protein [Deltaproteobacteria bacterium]
MRALVLITLVGCAYKPDSFSYVGKDQHFAGERATVGCLDIAVARRADMDGAAILAYEFGNRCDRPTSVDLAYAQVIGRTDAGAEIKLMPYDPKGQMRALQLDGRAYGNEALAYPSETQLAQICVDVASIAHTTSPKWLCLSAAAPAPDS